MGKGVLTRLYIGVDPRHSADAFKALIEEMSKNGSMRDVDIAFNERDIKEGEITNNMLIIYEPLSRPEVLEKVLSAYRAAKMVHPNIFNLSPAQKEAIMRSAFIRFKAVVDPNLSFVEIDPEDLGESWDLKIIKPVQDMFELRWDKNPDMSDEEWLEKVKKGEGHRIILTKKSQQAMDTGQIKSGDQVEFTRKLGAPALIQRGMLSVK